MQVPKPVRKKKVKKHRRSKFDRNYECPKCHEMLHSKSITDKKNILKHLCDHVIFERDKKRCAKCGSGGHWAGLAAHHIFPKGAYPAGKFMLDNLVLLCAGCHNEIHHRGKTEEFRRWVIPWLAKRLKYDIPDLPDKVRVLQEEQLYDWLFARVLEYQGFRASDFERIKKELEDKQEMRL